MKNQSNIQDVKLKIRSARLKANNEIEYSSVNSLFDYMREDKVLARKMINSFNELYCYDKSLINPGLYNSFNHVINHVCERAIVFRYAHYLLNSINANSKYNEYDLDCEYNRNCNSIKETRNFPKGTYPDLIIHKRETNCDNLLVIEFKTWWNHKTKRDIIKITDFMSSADNYHFKYGMSIILNKDSVTINCVEPR